MSNTDADARDDLDEIRPWSEIKLEIIKEYSRAYTTILAAQPQPFRLLYVDAFAGAGSFVSRTTGLPIPGSPLNALDTEPPFHEFHFIDIKSVKVARLEATATDRQDVFVHHGDANQVLRDRILPRVRWNRFERALCLLDPYGLHYDWDVVEALGRTRTCEVFFNFLIMAMNRTALRSQAERIDPAQAAEMTRFWGDETWSAEFFQRTQLGLFSQESRLKSVTNQGVVDAYRRRLQEVAGFSYVPESIPMRNSTNSDIYHLLFAAHKPVSKKIVTDIFTKYRRRGTSSGS